MFMTAALLTRRWIAGNLDSASSAACRIARWDAKSHISSSTSVLPVALLISHAVSSPFLRFRATTTTRAPRPASS